MDTRGNCTPRRRQRGASMKVPCAALLACLVLQAQTVSVQLMYPNWIQDVSDPQRGRLSGTVLDEHGHPASGITVRATPHVPMAAAAPHTKTDAQGRFAFSGLIPVETSVQAFEEQSFYPDTDPFWKFWDGEGSAEMTVPPGAEASVGITLRPAGRLDVDARDVNTGQAIEQISIHLVRVDSQARMMAFADLLRNWRLIPSAPVRLCVEAHGYHAAWYGPDGAFKHCLH